MELNFVAVWKAVSIVFTGAFGILGLLKDYKDRQTHKVTVWGKVSLAGILVSTLLGVAAQLKESSDSAAARRATAEQTLQLLQQTNATLKQVQRTLSSTADMEWEFGFRVPCEKAELSDFCQTVRQAHNEMPPLASDAELLRKWPLGHGHLKFDFLVRVYANNPQLDARLEAEDPLADLPYDLQYWKTVTADEQNCRDCVSLWTDWTNPASAVFLTVRRFRPELAAATGAIQSRSDLAGALVEVSPNLLHAFWTRDDYYNGLLPTHMALILRDGESMRTAQYDAQTEGPRVVRHGGLVYLFRLPQESPSATLQ
ncbi:MAG TPA: hypothetical protein VKB34_10985 [Povalibacter sp.]|nr:hypothetical protein [Povalibacter sp.]